MGFAQPRTYWVDDPIDNFRVRVTLYCDVPVLAPTPPPPPPGASAPPAGGRAGRKARAEGAAAAAAAPPPAEPDAPLLETGGRRAARRLGLAPTATPTDAPLDPADAPPPAAGSRERPFVAEFGWQQKALAPHEVAQHRRKAAQGALGAGLSRVAALFSRADAETGFRDRQYAEMIDALDADARAREGDAAARFEGQVLHTQVHVDRFVDEHELNARVTTSALERPTALASAVLSGRAYDATGAPPAGAADRAGDDDDGGAGGGDGRRLVVQPPPSQVMHICAELPGPPGVGGPSACASLVHVLCVVRAYGNGRVDMAPGFSPHDETANTRAPGGAAGAQAVRAPIDAPDDERARWYRLSARDGSRWRFRLESISDQPVDEAERRAERQQRLHDLLARKQLGGLDFSPPPADGGLRAQLFCEVVGAYGFGKCAPLVVQFHTHVHEGYSAPAGEAAPLHGLSHACAPKWVAGGERGGEYCAHFGHTFELSLAREAAGAQPAAHEGNAGLGASGRGSAAMGTLFVQVLSRGLFGRHVVEGYGYLPLLGAHGAQTHRVCTWRPCDSAAAHVRRFFAHEAAEVSDLRYLCVPSGVPSRGLNKYGFATETAGTVVIRINCVTQGQPRKRQPRATVAAALSAATTDARAIDAPADGLTKAERVRKKLEAKAKEREAAATSRRPVGELAVPP